MALTLKQLESLGFKPTKKESPFRRKFDTLVYSLNETDYLWLGYNEFRKEINNKIVWKSFVEPDTKNRIAYQITNIGSTGYNEMKAFLKRAKENANYKPSKEVVKILEGDSFLPTRSYDTSKFFEKIQENGEDVEETDPIVTNIL